MLTIIFLIKLNEFSAIQNLLRPNQLIHLM